MTFVVLVAAADVIPEVAQTVSAGVRDLGFAGMVTFLVTTTGSAAAEQRLHRGDGTP